MGSFGTQRMGHLAYVLKEEDTDWRQIQATESMRLEV
jgi:hypothetical protein